MGNRPPETAVTATTPGNAAQPAVSVVIPAYNAAETIERALNSVYAQTYPNIIEVIVVDDGSTDNTVQTVRERYPQVSLIQQENAGSPTARNHGVQAARGEYIAFLDDDDEWFAHKTSQQMQCVAAYPEATLTIASACQPTDSVPEETDLRAEELGFRDLFPSITFHYGCSGWVIRRDAFLKAGGFRTQLRRSQDTELLWRLASMREPIVRLHALLYVYYPSRHRRSAQNWREVTESWYSGMAPIVEEYCAKAEKAALLSHDEAMAACSFFHFRSSWPLWSVGSRVTARRALAEAVRCSPRTSRLRWRYRLASRCPGLCSLAFALIDTDGEKTATPVSRACRSALRRLVR